MVACYGPHEGPWLRARGNETGIRVTCLGEGEVIVVRHMNGTEQVHERTITADGTFPLPTQFSRISFKKLGGSKPTSVELVVG